jgi:hypothetical protein
MYVIVDRSGSMSSEITTVRNNLSTVVRNLTCPPLGTGDPATCIPDLWAGAGTVGYSGSGAATYSNFADLQPNANFTGLPITEPGGCCAEPLTFSVFAAVTGNGTAAATGCGLSGVNPRATCAGSPAANAGFATFGYPCFRQGALPVILLATDEPPLSPGDTNKCPAWSTVVLPQMTNRSAKLVGILGSGVAGSSVDTDLRTMATNTGAVDAAAGNAPLVFDGSGTNSAAAIENGIRTLANGVPLDLAALAADDPADAVDAVAAFVNRLETLQLGTAQCANMLTDRDSNGDGFRDAYDNVRAGTPVCWKLFSKQNDTVPATDQPQLFKATVTVTGDGVTTLDTRDVYFLVPPCRRIRRSSELTPRAATPAISHVGRPAISHVGRPAISHVGRPAISHVGRPAISHVGRPAISHVGRPAISHVGRPAISRGTPPRSPTWDAPRSPTWDAARNG